MYSVWLLVDFLVQVSMVTELCRKPRVTADQFRRHLRRRLDRLI
jgi:IS4 transposase